jgi:hypothetical protein
MLNVRSKRSYLHSGPSFSGPRQWMPCYPQIRHEHSRISPRTFSRRHCLPKTQRLYEIEEKPLEVPGMVQSVQTNADVGFPLLVEKRPFADDYYP